MSHDAASGRVRRERLLAAFRGGDAAGVDRMLAEGGDTLLDHPEAAAVAVAHAFDRGAPLPLATATGLGAAALLQALIAQNRLDAAAAYAAAAHRHFGADAPIGGLWRYLRSLPPATAGMPFHDDPARDVQIVRRAEARGVLLVFCGAAQRFGAPLNIMHRWFAALPFHIVYLRDRHRIFYLHGVASLGAGLAATIAGCRALVAGLGGGRTLCVGNSAGVYGALLIGRRLDAEAVLAFSGPTDLSRSADEQARRQSRLPPVPDPFDAARLGLGALYRDAGAPRVRLFYGAANENDAWHAARMAEVPGAQVVPIPGQAAHDSLGPLIREGRFAEQLAWLDDPGIPAGPP